MLEVGKKGVSVGWKSNGGAKYASGAPFCFQNVVNVGYILLLLMCFNRITSSYDMSYVVFYYRIMGELP